MKSVNQFVAVFVAFFVSAFFLIIVGTVYGIFENGEYVAEPDYGAEFSHMRVNVEWREDRTCRITQNFAVMFLDDGYLDNGSHGIYYDIPVNSGEKIRNLTVTARGNYRSSISESVPYVLEHESGFKIVRVRIGDEDRVFYEDDTLTATVEYDYITPVHPDNKNLLDINAIGYGWMNPVADATVTVTYPTAVSLNSVSAESGAQGNTVAVGEVSLSDDGKTVTVRAGSLAPFNGVRVKCEMPDGLLSSNFDIKDLIIPGIGMILLLLVVVLMLVLGKDKPLSPVVNFYPPRVDGADGEKHQMLPVQMGKIIDGTCSLEDVTSLIFYWASKGFIRIEEESGETYFVKLKDIEAVTGYEKRMFDKMFEGKKKKNDDTVRVSLSSLKGKFATAVSAVKTSVDNEYRGTFYKKGFNALAIAAEILTVVYGLCVGILCTFKVGIGFINLAGIMVLIPAVIAAFMGYNLVKNYVKLSDKKRRTFTVLLFAATIMLSVAVMFLVPTHVMGWVEKAVFAVCYGFSAALAPFLTVRTDNYTDELNEIVGFRDFIRDVEKDKLEALLEEDPQYYYNILPYANVLGVSSIWADKFKDITIEPPSYYSGYGHVSVFDVMIMHRLCNSVGKSLTYTPPKASGGSFSGGGGSHGGGGGGSFGGFGGGGGGRW